MATQLTAVALLAACRHCCEQLYIKCGDTHSLRQTDAEDVFAFSTTVRTCARSDAHRDRLVVDCSRSSADLTGARPIGRRCLSVRLQEHSHDVTGGAFGVAACAARRHQPAHQCARLAQLRACCPCASANYCGTDWTRAVCRRRVWT